MNNPSFVYFGGEPIGAPVLSQLEKAGLVPSLIVCSPDRPVGRKQLLTPPPVKVWATERSIPVWQPESLKDEAVVTEKLKGYDLFVVVAYNKILPKWLIELPEYQTINLHPSLLPLLRGASPIRSAILHDMKDQCGVSIMLLDEKMDHGPLVAQEAMTFAEGAWPVPGQQLDHALAALGGEVLATTIPLWIAGEITPIEQFHSRATYCRKIDRADGELQLDPHNLPTGHEAYAILLKIRAYDGFPETFFTYNGTRIKIHDASLADNGRLEIGEVTPAGKKRQSFTSFLGTLGK